MILRRNIVIILLLVVTGYTHAAEQKFTNWDPIQVDKSFVSNVDVSAEMLPDAEPVPATAPVFLTMQWSASLITKLTLFVIIATLAIVTYRRFSNKMDEEINESASDRLE